MSFIPEEIIQRFKVNHGGCGIAAILLANKLKSDKFLWCSGLFCEQGITAPSHYFVCHNNKAVDITGEMELNEVANHFDIIKEVKPEFVLATIANRDSWNNDFDRSNTIHLASLLEVEVPDYLKQVI